MDWGSGHRGDHVSATSLKQSVFHHEEHEGYEGEFGPQMPSAPITQISTFKDLRKSADD